MSEVLEKTLGPLQNIVAFDSVGIPCSVSRGCMNFINLISSVKSKHAEEQLIRQEISLLQQRLAQPNNTPHQLKDYMLRLIYCEMLGYPVPFAYVQALTLAQQGSLLDKRIGYLAATLFLQEDSELVLLLVNTVQKDLKSTSIADICMALTAICKLVNTEIISLLLPLVEEKLSHPREVVRKKAVIAFHKMNSKTPYLVFNLKQRFGKVLCDSDPSVMAVSLYILHDIIKTDPHKWEGILINLIQVLQQILCGKLHHDYTYHNVPAPWLQIQILKIFCLLGRNNPRCDELLTEVLKEVLDQAEINHNIAYAIVFECIQTISSLPFKSELLELAMMHCGKFLRSSSNNLKYLGVVSLSNLVTQVSVTITQRHQADVLECLQHPDVAIRVKTLDLMYKMANSKNVSVICQHMVNYLSTTTDGFVKIGLTNKIQDLIWRFAPSKDWLLHSMASLMKIKDIRLSVYMVNNLLHLLAHDLGDPVLQTKATELFTKLMLDDNCSSEAIQVAAWVLGEYGHLIEEDDLQSLLQRLSLLLPNAGVAQAYIISAFVKLTLKTNVNIPSVETLDTKCNLKQQIQELQQLLKRKKDSKNLNIQTLETELDSSLTFLDGYVNQALDTGVGIHRPRHNAQLSKLNKPTTNLLENFYYQPFETASVSGDSSSQPMSVSSEGTHSIEFNTQIDLNVKDVNNVWSREGLLIKQRHAAEPQAQNSPPEELLQESPQQIPQEAFKEDSFQALSMAMFSEDVS